MLAGNGYVIKNENAKGDITYTVNSAENGKGAAGTFQFTHSDGTTTGSFSSITMHRNGTAVLRSAEARTGSHIKSSTIIKLTNDN